VIVVRFTNEETTGSPCRPTRGTPLADPFAFPSAGGTMLPWWTGPSF